MKRYVSLALLFLLLLSLAGFARAQGTAFTYQGRLNDAGAPANGLYDFTFALFDAQAGGAALAGPVSPNAVSVSSGVFTVSLDFGANVFTGPARWLEISVRKSGVGSLITLAPRTPLSPAPYAIYAGSAGSVPVGTVTANQLNTGGVAPTPGQFLSYDGGNFRWADAGVASGNIWSRNGADAFYNAGNVGIGTNMPAVGVRLQVNGLTRIAPGGSGGFLQIGAPGGETGLSILGDNRADLRFNGQTLTLGTGPNAGPTPYQNGIVINTNGNVGVGMGAPFPASPWKLEVNGPTRVTPRGAAGGAIQFSTPNTELGMSILGANRADVRFDDSTLKLVAGLGNGTPGNASGLSINTAGNVGIGTLTPQARLHVEGGMTVNNGRLGVGTTAPVARLHAETPEANTAAVYGKATGPGGVGVVAASDNGPALRADGDATQSVNKGGFVKAMAFIDPFLPAAQYVVRCFNSQQSGNAVSTAPCGIQVFRTGVGTYTIDFGFNVQDRFISLTTLGEFGGQNGLTVGTISDVIGNRVRVAFSEIGDPQSANDVRFYIFVY